MTNPYQPKCSYCGKFCVPFDSGVPIGTYGDIDEPDEEYFCPKCAKEKIEIAKKTPQKIIIRCWYIRPNYVQVAKSVLRHKRERIKNV